jgi:hypothetical protein
MSCPQPVLKICGWPADHSCGQWAIDWEVGMRCPSCAKASIIEIRMRVSGSDLTFRRCGGCESQTWEAPEGVVPLTRVLELVRAT